MTEQERWKEVSGFPGIEVSSFGAVRSWRKPGPNPLAKKKTPTLLKTFTDEKGYVRIGLSCRKKKKTIMFLVHRLVATAFIPNPESKPHVAHWDGNPSNNNVSNLRFATAKENALDSERLGTRARGERMGAAKLTNRDVLEIREITQFGIPQRDIAKAYGISQGTLWSCLKKGWKHV